MAMKRVNVQGHTLNKRTADMLNRAEQMLGHDLDIMQGSYNSTVGASAGTHDGGGAVDVAATSNPAKVVLALRKVGFAAWHRLPSQGPWPEHIHAIAIGDGELSSGAKLQVQEYYAGQNGLANHGPDDGPRLHPIPTWPIALPRLSLQRAINQFTAKKPRSAPATKKIQTALNYRLSHNLVVDGVAGPKTRAAYKWWEKHIDSPTQDGVPGEASLKKLVAGHYRVVK